MYVAISEIAVPDAGAEALTLAFQGRLHGVDGFEGFQGLEVLQDRRRSGRFLMVTRWDSKDKFLGYMRSRAHRASHDRIPRGPNAPRPAGFAEYDLVAR
jgi:heme-degrading monooxygenase HmoA